MLTVFQNSAKIPSMFKTKVKKIINHTQNTNVIKFVSFKNKEKDQEEGDKFPYMF
jgi:hypothetical protein